MAVKQSEPKSAVIQIFEMESQTLQFYIVGKTPLICNSFSAKAKQNILCPPAQMNKTEKETTLRHDPAAEYRASIDRMPAGKKAPTLIALKGGAFKGLLLNAAMRMPGSAKKTEIGQLCRVVDEDVAIYGIPKLRMDMVRNAGMNRTPDVRTRACLERWCATLTITFNRPQLTDSAIVKLLNGGGDITGVGDYRPEKGKGTNGRFAIVNPEDKEYQQIVFAGGRAVQEKAMQNFEFYNEETAELFAWWKENSKSKTVRGKAA